LLKERQTRALGFTPRTTDDEARTVELVASTGAGVPRVDMEGPFLEVLSLERSAIDLSRVDGMPLLDSHRQDGVGRVLGVARSVRIESGQLIVTVEFSERADPVWEDVKRGIIRNVSIGYTVDRFADSAGAQGRTRTATKWTLMEVSLVPVGADAGAQTRELKCLILPRSRLLSPSSRRARL
jgi:HK97 family phage prohead protease